MRWWWGFLAVAACSSSPDTLPGTAGAPAQGLPASPAFVSARIDPPAVTADLSINGPSAPVALHLIASRPAGEDVDVTDLAT
jgi:hypothetical protein